MDIIKMTDVKDLRCKFKDSKSLESRIAESTKIIEKYPDRVPIIVEICDDSTLKNIDKNKYLVPKDLTFSQFLYIIRKRINLNEAEALFLFINGKLVPSNKSMNEVYEVDKDEDGFLYVNYTNENTFG
jgi:GABA(A) receptor-associated protein